MAHTQGRTVLDIARLPEGVQLRLARVAHAETLIDVVWPVNVSPPRLSEFERGRPALSADAVAPVRSVLAGEPAMSRPASGEAERDQG